MINMNDNTAMQLLEMFNATVKDSYDMVDYKTIALKGLKVGYLVMPEAANTLVSSFIDSQNININSTFYKEWSDVTSRSRFELFIDQIMHYASTYGTNYECEGNGFVLNDPDQNTTFAFDNYKVIDAVTDMEMMDRCYKMLCSGIALKSETMMPICNYVYRVCGENDVTIDIDNIKNREARIFFYDKFNTAPHDKFELIKYIYYKATDSAMIVKNDANLQKLKAFNNKFDFRILDDMQIKGLASIFYRYKDVILMFKNQMNSPIINKIRRLAKTYHKPMTVGFWESLTTSDASLDEIYERSAELNNYKLVTLINMMHENTLIDANSKKMYVVRNGKVFFKECASVIDSQRCNEIASVLERRLVSNLSKNNTVVEKITEFNAQTGDNEEREEERFKTVKIPANLNIACPTSEKNFIGNIPFGSYINMQNSDNIIGIYWRNEWGTRDFDISMLDIYGHRIGWNSSYYDSKHNVIYSGDMTNADPEAAELLYMRGTPAEGSIYVNRYNGVAGSKFEFFYAQDKFDAYTSYDGHMCNPGKIKVQAMLTNNDRQSMVGMIADNKFVFCDFGAGNQRVACAGKKQQEEINVIYKRKLKSMLSVVDVLEMAGYKITTDSDAVCDIDLVDLKKDTIINLFA